MELFDLMPGGLTAWLASAEAILGPNHSEFQVPAVRVSPSLLNAKVTGAALMAGS